MFSACGRSASAMSSITFHTRSASRSSNNRCQGAIAGLYDDQDLRHCGYARLRMNWDDSYTVSRSIVLQIGDGGELLAGNSVSRMPQALSQDGLPILLAFAGGRTPAEALERLRNEWEIDDSGFTGVVEALIAQ